MDELKTTVWFEFWHSIAAKEEFTQKVRELYEALMVQGAIFEEANIETTDDVDLMMEGEELNANEEDWE